MAGLFEKDIRLILRNKQMVIVVAFMALMMSFSGSIDMVLPYMTVFGTIFSVSTISFDEADNGYSYIMTLPVTYKDYVYEKYMFCTAGGIAAGLVTMVFFLIGTGIRGTAVVTSDMLIAAAAVLPLIVIIESFLIPVQLRFGNSKSRIFIMVLIGAVIASVYVMDIVVGDVEQKAAEVIKAVDGIKPLYVIIGVAAATMIILAVSVMCSMRVMRRKQY